MTTEVLTAAIITEQSKGGIEPETVFIDRTNAGPLMLSFVCRSYSVRPFGIIAKHYTVELQYVNGFRDERALIGLLLTPKTTNQ